MTNQDVIKFLETIKTDIQKLHSGNVAHKKYSIMGNINYILEDFKERVIYDEKGK